MSRACNSGSSGTESWSHQLENRLNEGDCSGRGCMSPNGTNSEPIKYDAHQILMSSTYHLWLTEHGINNQFSQITTSIRIAVANVQVLRGSSSDWTLLRFPPRLRWVGRPKAAQLWSRPRYVLWLDGWAVPFSLAWCIYLYYALGSKSLSLQTQCYKIFAPLQVFPIKQLNLSESSSQENIRARYKPHSRLLKLWRA